MADHSHSDYNRGDMDINEQSSTYAAVYGMIKWCSVALAASLTFVVLWFCTPAGPFAGLVVGALIAILGVVFLRAKPHGAH